MLSAPCSQAHSPAAKCGSAGCLRAGVKISETSDA